MIKVPLFKKWLESVLNVLGRFKIKLKGQNSIPCTLVVLECVYGQNLDRVGPVDNRPSPD